MEQRKNDSEKAGFQKLRQNPESLQVLLDSIVCGILTTDRYGRITFTNNSARQILGRPRSDLIGAPYETLNWQKPDGGAMPPETHPFSRALHNGEVVRGEMMAIEETAGERHIFSMDVIPLRDQDDQIEGVAADFVDVSERFRLQAERDRLVAALQESETRFRLLAEGAPVGVFECDGTGRWLYLNPRWEEISGYSRETSLGHGWLQAVHPEERAKLLASWRLSNRRPGVWTREFRLQHPGGGAVWVQALVQAVSDGPQGDRFVGIVEDVTTRKETMLALERAKAAAEEANLAKSRFLSMISHEIRTPMTVFMGMVELTLAEELAPEQRRYLESAQNCAETLLTLIEDVLLFAELENSRLVLRTRSFTLADFIRQTATEADRLAGEKGLQFKLVMAPDLPDLIEADPNRLRQILNNLLGNAIKFTDAGEVELRVEQGPCRGKPALRFSVRDSGIGIASTRLERAFLPLSKVDGSSTRLFSGTGLGLTISKGLVEAMGGEITAESTAGQGSLFSFVIPLAPSPPERQFDSAGPGR